MNELSFGPDETYRNLYGLDYVKEHGKISTPDFARVWDAVDPWTKKV